MIPFALFLHFLKTSLHKLNKSDFGLGGGGVEAPETKTSRSLGNEPKPKPIAHPGRGGGWQPVVCGLKQLHAPNGYSDFCYFFFQNHNFPALGRTHRGAYPGPLVGPHLVAWACVINLKKEADLFPLLEPTEPQGPTNVPEENFCERLNVVKNKTQKTSGATCQGKNSTKMLPKQKTQYETHVG